MMPRVAKTLAQHGRRDFGHLVVVDAQVASGQNGADLATQRLHQPALRPLLFISRPRAAQVIGLKQFG